MEQEARELDLADSKTGARTVPISPEAADVLANIPHVEGSPWVISGNVKARHMRNLNAPWNLICKRQDRERAAPRLPPQLRLQGAGARRGAADDRVAARSYAGGDHRPLRLAGLGLPFETLDADCRTAADHVA